MIKKTLFLTLCLSLSLFADIKFKQYDEALKEAQKDNKIIALTVVSSACPWCHKLLQETLKDKTVDGIINKDFIYVVVNKDTSALPNGISARLVPTTYFLNKTGQKISQSAIGFWNAEDFTSYLTDAVKKAKK